MQAPQTISTLALTLATPATAVLVKPGEEIVLKGSFRSTIDGSVIDATSTTGGPPGSDPGGLVDLEAGGFHVTSRDLATHEVHAVATSEPSATCSALGVSSPCLPLRLVPLAHSRLITVDQLRASLQGSLATEIPVAPAPIWINEPAARGALPIIGTIVGVVMLVAIIIGLASWQRARLRSPRARLAALADRVKYKADRADPALAAPLMPAVRAAMTALRSRKIDASSPQGIRIATTLEQLEARLDSKALADKDSREREVADELIHEMDAAVRAAEEAQSYARTS